MFIVLLLASVLNTRLYMCDCVYIVMVNIRLNSNADSSYNYSDVCNNSSSWSTRVQVLKARKGRRIGRRGR